MLQRALDLTDEVLRVSISADINDLKEDWPKVVFLHLLRSQRALRAIRLVVAEGLRGPATVLHRYIFELAVNLVYIHKDIKNRVPLYLEHGFFRLTLDELAEIGEKLDSLRQDRDYSGIVELLIPSRSWKTISKMCEEVGMVEDYNTMYRSSSEQAHGGANSMALEILTFLGLEQEEEYEFPGILIGALLYYSAVMNISCQVFPDLQPNFEFPKAWHESFERVKQEITETVRNTNRS